MAAWHDEPRFGTLRGSRTWAVLTLLLLIVKLAALAVVALLFQVDPEGTVYPMLARNLVATQQFVIEPGWPPCLWRGPVYPVMLAGIWSITGIDRHLPVILFHAVLDVATCLLLFDVARRIIPWRLAVVAALAIALYPPSNYYSLRFQTEAVYTFLVAGFAWLAWRAARHDVARDEARSRASRLATRTAQGTLTSLAPWIALGALIGFAALTRPAAVYLGLVTAVWVGWSKRDLRPAAALLLASVLVISPWTLRNYRVTGEFVPVATGGGFSVWVGARVASDGLDDGGFDPDVVADFQAASEAIAGPATRLRLTPEVDRAYLREGLRGIADQPWESLLLTFKRAYRFWFSAYTPERSAYNWVLLIMNSMLLVGAAIGLASMRRGKADVWPLLLPVVYTFGMHTLVISTVRYSVPVMPLVVVLAAIGASGWVTDRRSQPE